MAAKEKDAKALPEGQEEKPKKSSKLKRIVILLAILLILLAGGGVGGYWWFFVRTPAPDSGTVAEAGSGNASEAVSGAGGTAGTSAPATAAVESGGGRIERQTPLPRSMGQVLPLPPVTVNISGQGGQRYLKLGMEVEVNADVSAVLKEQTARIRDAIIMLLAGKTVDDITSPDGKVLLKAEVVARLNQILGAQRIIRVYFTDFVIQ